MKKYIITMFAFALLSAKALAQFQTPEFVMPFWFEDAIGNKDTVWIGSDQTATYGFGFDTQFGEIPIITPFDSVFEVRVVNTFIVDGNNWLGSKINIEGRELSSCLPFSGSRILIHAIHLPVTVSWDVNYLLNSPIFFCYQNSFFTPDQTPFLIQYWWQANYYQCLDGQSSFQTNFDYWNGLSFLEHDYEVQGQGTKRVKGFYVMSHVTPPPLPCFEQSISTKDLSATENQFIAHPNPLNKVIYLEQKGSHHYQLTDAALFDISGKQVRQWTGEALLHPLIVGELTSGMYFLQLTTESSKRELIKLVKL